MDGQGSMGGSACHCLSLSTAPESHALAVAHATSLLLAGHVVALAAPPKSSLLAMFEAATQGALVKPPRAQMGKVLSGMEFTIWVRAMPRTSPKLVDKRGPKDL